MKEKKFEEALALFVVGVFQIVMGIIMFNINIRGMAIAFIVSGMLMLIIAISLMGEKTEE